MNLMETYAMMGADGKAAAGRVGSEDTLGLLARMFLEDGTYAELEAAVEAEDADAAFEAAHTLKGLSLNLGLDPLTGPACALTDALRAGQRDLPAVPALWQEVKQAYARVAAALARLD